MGEQTLIVLMPAERRKLHAREIGSGQTSYRFVSSLRLKVSAAFAGTGTNLVFAA